MAHRQHQTQGDRRAAAFIWHNMATPARGGPGAFPGIMALQDFHREKEKEKENDEFGRASAIIAATAAREATRGGGKRVGYPGHRERMGSELGARCIMCIW